MLDADLVKNKILYGEFDIKTQSLLKRILIVSRAFPGAVLQEFLMQHEISSNMWVIVRKLN